MTSLDVCEAIASVITNLWPDRFLYRDFLPENQQEAERVPVCDQEFV